MFDIHDFDERGVPDNVTIGWRVSETAYWMGVAKTNNSNGISTIICGNAIPQELPKDTEAVFLMLDLSEEKIRERLQRRYSDPEKVKDLKRMTGQTPEESIVSNIQNTHSLRKLFLEHSTQTIDTSNMTPDQVATEVSRYISIQLERDGRQRGQNLLR